MPRFRLSVSEHSCWYYNILSDRVLFLTEISVFLSILLPKFIDWVLIMKWSNDSLWLMSYGKYFDHEMVEWYHMENILTMRWSNDFIRHLPYNETWAGSALFLPQGGTHFQLVPLGSPQEYFIGKFSPLTSIKFLHPMPPVQKWSKLFAPEKIEETWKNWLSTHYYYTRPSK